MRNTQPQEGPVDKCDLEVNHIFQTIQGEGPFAGWPATFIRLAGCNLQCTWCDTEYTARQTMTAEEIGEHIEHKLVVITGGEPFRQNIYWLVRLLRGFGCIVQIETNGTLFDPRVLDIGVTIVVSPKTKNIDARLTMCDNDTSKIYFKYLFGEGAFPSQPGNKGGDPFADAPRVDYIMPLDSGNPLTNLAINSAAVEYCLKTETKLTLQQHKILGID